MRCGGRRAPVTRNSHLNGGFVLSRYVAEVVKAGGHGVVCRRAVWNELAARVMNRR